MPLASRHRRSHFNPRAPCGARLPKFQHRNRSYNFNPRAPCGARQQSILFIDNDFKISIHAPRAGRDRNRREYRDSATDFNPRAPCGARRASFCYPPVDKLFQSTRPVRGATRLISARTGGERISIHAPRAGRDLFRLRQFRRFRYFNPRAPCGARPRCTLACSALKAISIHAPRAGRDPLKIVSGKK